MFKQIKTIVLCAGLLASLLGAGTALAAKPKAAEAAPAAAAPAPVTAPAAAASEVAAPVAAPAPAAAAPAAEEENPYGLSALWNQGDFVAKGTLLILVIMSMGSWYVIFTKFAEQAKINKQAREAQDNFWSAGSVAQGKDALAEGSAFRFIAEKGLEGASKHTGMLGTIDFNDWVTMSLQRAIGNVQSRMQDGLAFLATVGSTAPFVGLFGTVWGIYHALVKIGMSGQASIDKVAGPVGEALIMTAIGLAVAVPAVLGYNWLVRRNKAAMEEINAFGSDLHSVLLASAKK
ncbi:MotA/TolQ/ExbB proton channel family protein [Limnohabitans radicicola]|uniref:Biopolymer transport protein ExbB n=1 Tax=Limnohabitans radicicola TaxID=2771427 RepID=A0A927ING7_9BURK|nr:MotA/TolQ/ExbB proton channel family protein [Limnohabitans radicicola]MBD8052042.1 MotA/TolQ/ExbB proton channel family protein [Limnohabitans radicicola]